ncbi:NAD-dependent epimerase/dehydratase family protein [Hymenobacter weizhouensis]|uniref:NAD-dependent epimerase/dehydratase family protein n=1 Tax=Hymenobacter sp. YIM 151500-1 TaxID=2987689 RepID=UPI002225C295|nr:NAD-dependent epimerase/dehydratase family protein [Hymenobacter sp. YIM 151500-1]UYZ63155.1 NAD-dependent epimerase/dehydratase family protein [Hymenobacter sp. YIM 151500-1]
MQKPTMILAGGTGFLGRNVARYFAYRGFRVVTLSRQPGDSATGMVQWDGRTLGPWAAELEGAAVVLNLAGRSVDCRYHAANKRAILHSRTESTRVLGEAIARCHRPPAVWLNS